MSLPIKQIQTHREQTCCQGRVWERDRLGVWDYQVQTIIYHIYICITELLCCTPETNTTL